MAHPYADKMQGGGARAKAITKGYNCGGMTRKAAGGPVLKRASGGGVETDLKPEGRKSGGRLDKFARGGRSKGKGNHTKININIAPKGPHPTDGAASPAPMGPPLMGGGPPPGLPPGGPPGGLPPGLGAGPPPAPPPGLGGPKPPGMMKRGGVVKKARGGPAGHITEIPINLDPLKSGQSNLDLRYPSRYGNSPATQGGMDGWIAKGGKRENYKKGGPSKRAAGGKVPMKAGADTGPGRLQKAKAYNARG